MRRISNRWATARRPSANAGTACASSCCFLEARQIGRIQDVDLKLLDDYRLCLIEHAYSDHTIESAMRSVKLFYQFMEDKNEVFDNPAHRLRIPKAAVFSEPCSPKTKCNAFWPCPISRARKASGTGPCWKRFIQPASAGRKP